MPEAQKAAAKADEKETKAEERKAEHEAKEQAKAEQEMAKATIDAEGFTSHEVAFAEQLFRSLGLQRAVGLAYAHSIHIGNSDHNAAVQRTVGELVGEDLHGKDAAGQAGALDLDDADVKAAAAFLDASHVEPLPVEE
jgi:hypothetical protein